MASPPIPVLHLLGQLSRARTTAAFAWASRDVRGTQRARLQDILRRNADTEYGRRHGFHDVKDFAHYAQRVPFMGSADLEPLVNRLMAGERNVLTAEAPVYYVRTTGSTGAAKHIPITPSYRAEFQRTVHVALWHLYLRFPEAFQSTALYFVGSRHVARAPDGNDVGTMSGFNFTEMPAVVRSVYAWPYELFELTDLRTRSFLSLLLACLNDPSLVVGIFPSSVVYMLRDLARDLDELAFCARRGTLPDWLVLTAPQRAFFQALVHPRPDVAQRLETAAGLKEAAQVRLVWPSLRLIYCWTAASAANYLPELHRRLGPGVDVRDAIYSACEGWCNVPMGEPESGGALGVTSHFYEFIEERAYEEGRRDTLVADELQDGKRYQIVLTTSGGLYRYLLHDIVEVCGFHGRVPRIRFARKFGASCNLAGEKLEEAHVNQAVQHVLSACAVDATYFCLAPQQDGLLPGYRLFLEPSSLPAGVSAGTLCNPLDQALGSASYDYGRMRRAGHLAPVALTLLPPGTYDAFRRRRVADGIAEAQMKIAHLVADPAQLPAEVRAVREA